MAKSAPSRRLTNNQSFKLLLWINGVLCAATCGIMVWISTTDDPLPKARERLLNSSDHVFTLTAGAFIGLLGGRAAIPDPRRD